MNDPYNMQNLAYEWVDFSQIFKIFPNLAKIGSKVKKILEKWWFAQSLAQIWAD